MQCDTRIEQDHRGIKQRYYPMHGFGRFASAARFCRAFDELGSYFRPHCMMGKSISLSEQRRAFLKQLVTLQVLLQSASEQEKSSNQHSIGL